MSISKYIRLYTLSALLDYIAHGTDGELNSHESTLHIDVCDVF
jgi:hypothetical protein